MFISYCLKNYQVPTYRYLNQLNFHSPEKTKEKITKDTKLYNNIETKIMYVNKLRFSEIIEHSIILHTS